jgi:UDP-GlcNAc:undecaprenyl-phosphate GlcNAc-1-phosphate transferase
MSYKLNIIFFTVTNICLLLFLVKNINFFYSKKILIDTPDNIRKTHKYPTPLIGGLIVGIFFFLLTFYQITQSKTTLDILLITLIPLVVFLIGLYDDIFFIDAYKKLGIIGVVILLTIYFEKFFLLQNIYFSSFNKIFSFNEYYSLFFTTLCILLLINALNLADGINGLAVGMVIIWLFFLSFFTQKEFFIILIPLIILLIFEFFYIIKGKFFLGDNGSLLLGTFISLITIHAHNFNLTNKNLISAEDIFILFMLPGFDMFRLFIFRIWNKKDPFSADKNHLHHLLNSKFNLKKTLTIYLSIIITFIILNKLNILKPIFLIIIFLIFYAAIIKILSIKR